MKIGFVIGRFQVPGGPHSGHMSIFRSILEENDVMVVMVGSANRPESVKNPYPYTLRRDNIVKALQKTQFVGSGKNVLIFPVNDYLYNDSQWLADTHSIATKAIEMFNGGKEPISKKVARLYGHFKEGNDYLTWFPSMDYVNIKANDVEISGTAIRRELKHLLPLQVQCDMEYYAEETKKFSSYPYPNCLNVSAADAVVECLGHVLLVERKFTPGAGTWALPGGHKEKNETFKEAAKRELYEETNIRIPEKVLDGSIKATGLFDHPGRSSGVPKHTLAVHYVVAPNPDGSLPRANGGDDASQAKWVTISDALNNYALFDDHADIISQLTGVRPTPAVNKLGYQHFIL